MTMIDCRYCEETHGDLLLCGPAKRFLDAVLEQGRRFDMPTLEFGQPMTDPGILGDDTVLLAQFVVKAAVVPVAGMCRPVLAFTGVAIDGRPLPNWLYAGTPGDIRRTVKLVADMGEMAIRRARQQSGRPS